MWVSWEAPCAHSRQGGGAVTSASPELDTRRSEGPVGRRVAVDSQDPPVEGSSYWLKPRLGVRVEARVVVIGA